MQDSFSPRMRRVVRGLGSLNLGFAEGGVVVVGVCWEGGRDFWRLRSWR